MLTVVIACDVDPDRRLARRGFEETETLTWDGIERGIARFEEFFQWPERAGGFPKVTWCLRSDDQLQSLLGDPAWPVCHYSDVWSSRLRSGDSLGWHPHLWRRSPSGWYHERGDPSWIQGCLRMGWEAIQRYRPIKVAKMGFGFHSNLTLKVLEEMGLRMDLTALPGMVARDSRGIVYDWSRAPRRVYRPSTLDYQTAGEPRLGIWLAPNTTYEVPFSARLARFVSRRRRESNLDFWNPTKHPSFSRTALRSARRGSDALLIGYFHPDELLFKRGLFRGEYLRRNLQHLVLAAARTWGSVRFVTAEELFVEIGKWAQ